MDQASSLRKIVSAKARQTPQRLMTPTSPDSAISAPAPRAIAVTSGKGGVGKTNIVGSLALVLASRGHKVLILDADLGLANIDIIFGVHPKFNIGHVLNGEKTLSEIIVEGPAGIQIVPAGSGFTHLTHLTEGQKLNLLGEFEAFGAQLDVMLIDTGAGISANVLYFNLAADDCIIVATPEPTAITDAYAMMKVMFLQHGTRHFQLLVNMATSEQEAKSVYASLVQAAERFLNGVVIQYLGMVPSDHNVTRAVRDRRIAVEAFPEAAWSRGINALADQLMDAPRRQKTDGNIKFFFKRFIEFRL
ncbi:MAG: MinD/ParA family protein [Desulfobacterales bacterium]